MSVLPTYLRTYLHTQALAIIKQEAYPKLSGVLFGEGVLNDAVSILLFRTVSASSMYVCMNVCMYVYM